ncbi:MAG: DUF4423 domain-containing protein [Polyangiaceae bacterium]
MNRAQPAFDYEALAAELVRALRGRRSQIAASRRVGAHSNVVHAWEARRAFPSASQFFALAERLTQRGRAGIESFYQREPGWLVEVDPWTKLGPARFLQDLRANRSILDIARATGIDRFAVGRYLKGRSEPRLPDFLHLIDVLSLRLLDFVESFVNPERLPSVVAAWEKLQIARRAAYDAPWSQAVLRVLELEEYQRLPRHRSGYIARLLGISREQEQEALELLEGGGQIRKENGRFRVVESLVVDTRRDPAGAERTRRFWANVVANRLRAQPGSPFAYNLFSVSREDMQRIRELERAFFRDLRQIVAASSPSQSVALVTIAHLEFRAAAPKKR